MTRGGDTKITLQNSAKLIVENTLNISSGTLSVTGNQTQISGAQVILRGTYNPVITTDGISAIQVSNSLALGGTINPTLQAGVATTLGSSWTIAQGTTDISGDFDKFTGPQLQKGAHFATEIVGTDLNLIIEKALTLDYNTVTGRSQIIDHIGGIEIMSYVITSKNNLLNTANWNSLTDVATPGFEEATPEANQVAELNLHQTVSFTAGQTHDLGSLISKIDKNKIFGETIDEDEFKLSYKTADGITHAGILDGTSTKNNLVLAVDPTTGMATLQNHSMHTIDLLSYVIESENGSLNTTGWNSLDDQDTSGWDEATPTNNQLSELNLEEMLTLESGDIINLGNAITAESLKDLVMSFSINTDNGTQIIDGIVVYGDTATELIGDYDLNGRVDSDDLAIVQGGFQDQYSLEDLFAVRNNFGATSAASIAIPEPTSIALVGLSLIATLKRRKK